MECCLQSRGHSKRIPCINIVSFYKLSLYTLSANVTLAWISTCHAPSQPNTYGHKQLLQGQKILTCKPSSSCFQFSMTVTIWFSWSDDNSLCLALPCFSFFFLLSDRLFTIPWTVLQNWRKKIAIFRKQIHFPRQLNHVLNRWGHWWLLQPVKEISFKSSHWE